MDHGDAVPIAELLEERRYLLDVARWMLGSGSEAESAVDETYQRWYELTEAARESLFPVIKRLALAWKVVVIPAAEIDAIGIHVANIEGMRRAVAGLDCAPGYVLTDGFRVPGLAVPSLPVIGGDASAACIAAASVLAKVTRDRMMVELDQRRPGYGFAEHKGYNTAQHLEALRRLGPCPEHRRSWRTVRECGTPVTAAAESLVFATADTGGAA